mmetsp:Transcript_23137/g.46290  ORF Transcript_23137/g.46290 Transcript_23137/m.46290 type:complete len:294 (-) Transcript_23137:143-1024(-)|eukprot:CAMPEP_0174702770 /NCGR_PEP_ID=MMETSP1094-20130205/6946_1 /TAXON_ID=156173 /ORGANISM="Chrysochromulina brevifilum, Strain UTEX LB 985" /LENGTH=293 /DNA_ID=CAMNT_0015900589 /DNA_START=144 /DNA_END=1025 /DNA_ORIENTATION=+
MSPGITITLPVLPLTEILLAVIALQLFLLTRRVSQALPLLHSLATSGPAKPPATAAAPPPALPAAPVVEKRLLRMSADHFSAALLGDDDLDVALFMKALRAFEHDVLQSLGSFTMIACREVQSNVTKVEHTYALAPERFKSMRTLLEEEVTSHMHSAETGLADPSAAMGLLWARRGLLYWIALFKPVLAGQNVTEEAWTNPGKYSGRRGSGYNLSMAAYEESLAPFNGWVTRNMFTVAARATPDLFITGPKLASSYQAMLEDMAKWSEVVNTCLARMKDMHIKLDLEDLHKTL